MQGLSFRNDQDFEEICCYLMEDRIKQKIGVDLHFRRYGGNGQKQYGIDISPTEEGYGIFGQSKFVSKLVWNDIKNELNKTDSFPYLIESYVFFTTAHRHKSINEKQFNGEMWHIRPNGSRFQIDIVYWDEIKSIDNVPLEVRSRIFPTAIQIASSGLTLSQMTSSIASLQRIIPRYFHNDFLDWLETWDFSLGYVPLRHYNCVDNLYIEHDRTKNATNGITDWLYANGRVELTEAIPAGTDFFYALSNFRNVIREQTIGCRDKDGQEYLTLQGLMDGNAADFPKITNQWRMAAQDLAQKYRVKILGENFQ